MNRKEFLSLILLLATEKLAAKAIPTKKNEKYDKKKPSYIVSPFKNKNEYGFFVYNFKNNSVNKFNTSKELHGLCQLSETLILLISKKYNLAVIFDFEKNQIIQEIKTEKNRYFYGHACKDDDGFVYIAQTDDHFQSYLSKRSIKNLALEIQDIKIDNSTGIHECKFLNGLIYIASNGDKRKIPGSVIAYEPKNNIIKQRIEFGNGDLGPQHFDADNDNLYVCSSSSDIYQTGLQKSELNESIQVFELATLKPVQIDLEISKNLINACLTIVSNGTWLAATSRNEASLPEKIIVKNISERATKMEYSYIYKGDGCIFLENSFIFFSADQEPLVFDTTKKQFSELKYSAFSLLNIQKIRSNSHAYLI